MPIQNNPQLVGEDIKPRDRGGIGSLLFSSPLSAFKWYLHPGGLMATSLYARYGVQVPVMFTGVGNLGIGFFGSKLINKYIPKLGTNRLAMGGLRVLTGAGALFGPSTYINSELASLGIASDVQRTIVKSMGKAFRDKSLFSAGTNGSNAFAEVMSRVAAKTARYGPGMSTVLHQMMGSKVMQEGVKVGLNISRFGSFFTLPSTIITGAWLGAKLAASAFKSGVAAIDYASARAESVRALEFGGTLGAGYVSSASSNERQRAIRALQRNHLDGTPALGLEAQNYSALI